MPKQQNAEPTHECKTPYVYYSYEQWGRGYIGSRTKAGCYPGDSYLGSYSDETFKPTDKVILFTGTAEECLAVEVKLHEFFDVALNPHYANRARQISAGFTTAGTTQDEDWKRKAMRGLRDPANAQRGYAASGETNRRIKTNAYFSPEHRARAGALAVEANRENKTGCAFSVEWQNQRRLAHGWTREAWADIEAGLASGRRYWGLNDLLAAHSISFRTAQTIINHIKAGRTWDDVFGTE